MKQNPIAHFFTLAVQLLLLFCVLASPVSASNSGKVALGGSQPSTTVALGNVVGKSLSILDIFLDYRTKALGFCNGSDAKLPDQNRLLANPARDPITGELDPNYRAPEAANSNITSYPAPEGTRVQMALDESYQVDLLTGKSKNPGSFTTKDNITSVEQVRGDLAVKPEFKKDVTHVQDYEIKPGTRVQESTVGTQVGTDGKVFEGGGNQIQILPQAGQKPSDVLIPIGDPKPIITTNNLTTKATAQAPVGRSGQQVNFPNSQAPAPRNPPEILNGRNFSGHAIDRMQERGYTPAVVENVIKNGDKTIGNKPNTVVFTDAKNNIRVIVNSETGKVITITGGGK